MIQFIGWLSALVALVTGLAMLQDATAMPAMRTLRGVAQHWARLAGLIVMTACAAMAVVFPDQHLPDANEVWLRVALTGLVAMQSPCPWWRYVLQGLHRPKSPRVIT